VAPHVKVIDLESDPQEQRESGRGFFNLQDAFSISANDHWQGRPDDLRRSSPSGAYDRNGFERPTSRAPGFPAILEVIL
jgi:hypothetical protein